MKLSGVLVVVQSICLVMITATELAGKEEQDLSGGNFDKRLLAAVVKQQQNEIHHLKEEMLSMKNQVSVLMTQRPGTEAGINKSKTSAAVVGVTYVRWGRTTCEGAAQVVYKGYAASSFYSTMGGGSDYLCLPEVPQWGTYFDWESGYHSNIHGVEYQLATDGTPFTFENNAGVSLTDHNAPCVVCLAPERTMKLMIPAALQCPSADWNLEYGGYLVTENDASGYKKEYVCVDKAPEAVTGGVVSTQGALWYAVEVDCTTLSCPPYVNYREIACVICTQ